MLSTAAPTVAIAGAGLAGLACAVRLFEKAIPAIVVDSSDAVGGRVRTDLVEGFLLDRGFQVFLDAYPNAGSILDLPSLELRAFRAGALVTKRGICHRLMDVFRHPFNLPGALLQPIGSWHDKLLVARLRQRVRKASPEEIFSCPDRTTGAYLRDFGFSEAMIDDFFRPFYGGIFLEGGLGTSSRMFEFTFKMFSEGSATLPAKGMGEIPRQLAARLPSGSIRLATRVCGVGADYLELEGGDRLEVEYVVVATDGATAAELMPGLRRERPALDWHSVMCLYYAADRSPLKEGIIVLNAEPDGVVNNLCVPSDVAPGYAPDGKALVSVSVLGDFEPTELERRVRSELQGWFGREVEGWRHLRTDSIRRALPKQTPSHGDVKKLGFLVEDGVYVCGDHCLTSSIEGAITSGTRVAEAIRNRLATNRT